VAAGAGAADRYRGDSWDAVAPGLVVAVTIGVAVSVARDGGEGPSTDPVEIYRAAARALYAAKRDGSGIVLTQVVSVGAGTADSRWEPGSAPA
jgi:hypothetical protein